MTDSPGGEMTEQGRWQEATEALELSSNPYASALGRILDLHKPVTVYTPTPHCRVCGSLPWPCSTSQIVLDAIGVGR